MKTLLSRSAVPANLEKDMNRWMTSNVTGILTGIIAYKASDRLPILADALEEAGYQDEAALRAMRSDDELLAKNYIWLERVVRGDCTYNMAVRIDAEMWLRGYAMQVKPYEEPEEAYNNLIENLKDRELYYHGTDMHSRSDVLEEEKLKKYGEIVLGENIDFDKFTSFSCSC